jgi:hypothetical protein
MKDLRRRELLRLGAGALAGAAWIKPCREIEAPLAPSGSSADGTRPGASVEQAERPFNHLAELTAWYTAMDSTNGKVVHLFSDQVSYLMANNAIWTGTGLERFSYGGPHDVKNSFVKGWKSSEQSFRWNIRSDMAASYHLDALIGQNKGVTLRVQVGQSTFDAVLQHDGLDKVPLGPISIPAGDNCLVVYVPQGSFDMTLFSIELYPVIAANVIASRRERTRSKATWMANAPMGMMYQWGQWGGDAAGKGSPWPDCYRKFDYSEFADRLKREGADFLVWSITYSEYYVAAPIKAIDDVLVGRTSKIDYLERLLNECHKRRIRVIFYYHAGHDPNPNSAWWDAFWTAPLNANGVFALKEGPMNRFLNILTEIGLRYGEKLDGWMLDDGGIYYPAPFELLARALKSGNPDRIISFNSAYLFNFAPRMTEYEDFYFGETPKGASLVQWATNPEGVYTEGPFVREHAFANFQTESGNWGYFNDISGAKIGMKPDHSLNTTRSEEGFRTIAIDAARTHAMAAYDFRMYEDGKQSETSLDRFRAAAQAAHSVK